MQSLSDVVEALFQPSDDQRLVGVELELLVYHDDDRARPVSVDAITAALAGDPGLAAEANVSFEPGGQLELSPSPDGDAEGLLIRLGRLMNRTARVLSAHGLRAQLQGTDAWRRNDAVGLQKPTDRYLRMQQHFDRIGPAGRRMMRQTAALQVCVSLEPGDAGREQWLLANRMAPVLQARFANSPILEGRRTGMASTRSALWQILDPSRTGFNGEHYRYDAAAGYLAFAARAGWIPMKDVADPMATHLSTLFPPVRPRGEYLELRCMDAVPMAEVGLAVRLVSRLLHEPTCRRRALDMLDAMHLDMRTAWVRAARYGLADAQLALCADDLLAIADLPSASRERAA